VFFVKLIDKQNLNTYKIKNGRKNREYPLIIKDIFLTF